MPGVVPHFPILERIRLRPKVRPAISPHLASEFPTLVPRIRRSRVRGFFPLPRATEHGSRGGSRFFDVGTFRPSGVPTCFRLSLLFSGSSALFFATEHPQPLSLQSLPHSFRCHGVCNPPLAAGIFPGKREEGCQTETRKGEKGTGARGAPIPVVGHYRRSSSLSLACWRHMRMKGV